MHNLIETKKERAIVVGVTLNGKRWQTEDHLDELALLTDTAGAEVIDRIMQERHRIDSAYFIGRGKAERLRDRVIELDADIIIFDDDLSPAQVRNLEKLTNKKVLDRSGVILDIFARRAKTREARTQVELAQLNYLLPRLTRQWTHLSRQVGGIGTRGPGETQLEVDRRLIRKRISVLTRELSKIKSQRNERRRSRENVFKIALVGYTNAGKSTLLNTLTGADAFVEDRLFATLDPTIRRIKLDDRELLLIDTVGFIRKLPHNLVASFKSTLEEAVVADMLMHVVDISHPHIFEHIEVVNSVLHDLKISEKPTIFVFNKIDALEHKGIIKRLKHDYESSHFISAAKGLFVEDLKKELGKAAEQRTEEVRIVLDIGCSDIISKIYELSEVLETNYTETDAVMRVRVTGENCGAIKRLLDNQNGTMSLTVLSENGRFAPVTETT